MELVCGYCGAIGSPSFSKCQMCGGKMRDLIREGIEESELSQVQEENKRLRKELGFYAGQCDEDTCPCVCCDSGQGAREALAEREKK